MVSRRVVLEEERDRMKATILKDLAKDQIREGQVKNITDFGAFVDLGGIDGLLHITDMSWGRVAHPSELVKIGDKVTVKVLNFDPEKERISLGLKQLDAVPVGGRRREVPGRRPRQGPRGLDHRLRRIRRAREGRRGPDPRLRDVVDAARAASVQGRVNIGDEIEAVVLKVDKANEKISLGLKQIEPDPWLTLDQKYPPGIARQGQGPQPDQLRRVRRARGGHRRPRARLRHVVDQARRAPERGGQEGRRRSRSWSCRSTRSTAASASA